MDFIAPIVLGSAVVILTIVVLLLVRALAKVTPSLVQYGKTTVDAIKGEAAAEIERDEWLSRTKKAEAEKIDAVDRLAAASARIKILLEEEANERVRQIRDAPTAAVALDIFNNLLQDLPVLSAPAAPKTSGTGDSNSGETPVRPTGVAGEAP